jgi:hypothetical protein
LSQGAKIGVGVGVTLGTVGLVSLLAAVLLFRRKRHQHTAQLETPEYSKPELDSKNVPLHEMSAQRPIHEIATSPNERPLAFEMN